VMTNGSTTQRAAYRGRRPDWLSPMAVRRHSLGEDLGTVAGGRPVRTKDRALGCVLRVVRDAVSNPAFLQRAVPHRAISPLSA
jgi:hypothetical protein